MWQHFSNINKTIITVFIHVFYHVVNYIQSGTHSTCVLPRLLHACFHTGGRSRKRDGVPTCSQQANGHQP